MADLVWYVAYGSNLSQARLQEYLDRGPDPTPPRADRAMVIGQPLFFAGTSMVWGGGRAYVDHLADDPPATLARAWLLTGQQWADLHAQESGSDHRPGLDPRSLADGECRTIGTGRYDVVLGLGRHDDVPVLTITGPDRLDPTTCNRPEPEYLRRLATGLHEAHGLSSDEATTYLLARPGVAERWDRAELQAALGAGTGPG